MSCAEWTGVYIKTILEDLGLKPEAKWMLAEGSAYAKEININKLILEAKKQNKHIMIYFHIPNCSYCSNMLNENFKESELLEELANHYIFEDMYTKDNTKILYNDFQGSIKEFAKYIGAFAYSATIFIDNHGKTVYKSIGYRNTHEHLAEINYVKTKSYLDTDIVSFTEKWEFNRDE